MIFALFAIFHFLTALLHLSSVFRPMSKHALLLLLLLPAFLSAQVNTEKLRRDQAKPGLSFGAGLSAGIDRGNSEYVALTGDVRIDWTRDGNDNFVAAQYDFKESARGKISNRGFVHLRSMWELTALLTIEGFAQSEFNEFVSLRNRELLGAGTRWHLLQLGADSASLSLRATLGVGLMFEHEYYNTTPEDRRFDRLRSTNYLTVDFRFDDRSTLRAVTYYQPLPADPGDFRVVSETALGFAITRALTFTTTLSYRYNSRPVLDVREFDLHLRSGIRLSLP